MLLSEEEYNNYKDMLIIDKNKLTNSFQFDKRFLKSKFNINDTIINEVIIIIIIIIIIITFLIIFQ